MQKGDSGDETENHGCSIIINKFSGCRQKKRCADEAFGIIKMKWHEGRLYYEISG